MYKRASQLPAVFSGSLDAFHARELERRSGEKERLSDSDHCVAIRDGPDLSDVEK